MDTFAIILYPIVEVMKKLLQFYHSFFNSWGVAILFLSISTSVLMLPLQRIGKRIEKKIETRSQLVNAEIKKIDKALKGEKRFNEIERIYESQRYHPIQQLASAASIIMILPMLIAAVILFQQFPPLAGSSTFLFQDLSRPDGLLFGLNLLPVILFGVTLIDANSRFRESKPGFYKFVLLSIVLVALVYNLPAALLIFWIGNNVVSLLVFQMCKTGSKTLKYAG